MITKNKLVILICFYFIIMIGCKNNPEATEEIFDITGIWTITYNHPQFNHTVTSIYTFSGGSTGSVTSDNGASGNYTFSENNVSFDLTKNIDDMGNVTNSYTGNSSNYNNMSGSLEQSFEDYPQIKYQANWTASR